MHYVYLLQSVSHGRIYIGYTIDLKKRLTEHNKGLSTATKAYAPWELIFYEAYKGKEDAQKRESMLKTYPRTLGGLKRRLHKSLKRY